MVTKIDRCSRDTLSFLRLQEKLLKKSVTFISLDMPYSTDFAVNKLIATNLTAVAIFKNEIRERYGKSTGHQSIHVSELQVT